MGRSVAASGTKDSVVKTLPVATGRVLTTESFVPEAATLLPNETIKFEYQTPFPDEKTVSVIVTFSDEKRSGQYGY